MQKIIIFSILLILAVIGKFEAFKQQGTFYNNAYPRKCTIASLVLSPGQFGKHPRRCAKVKCLDTEGSVEIETCGMWKIARGFQLGLFKNPWTYFPKCCERYVSCK